MTVRYAFDRWHFEDPSVIGPPYVGGIVAELASVRDERRTCMGEKRRTGRLGLCHHQHLLLERILMIVSVRACLSSALPWYNKQLFLMVDRYAREKRRDERS